MNVLRKILKIFTMAALVPAFTLCFSLGSGNASASAEMGTDPTEAAKHQPDADDPIGALKMISGKMNAVDNSLVVGRVNETVQGLQWEIINDLALLISRCEEAGKPNHEEPQPAPSPTPDDERGPTGKAPASKMPGSKAPDDNVSDGNTPDDRVPDDNVSDDNAPDGNGQPIKWRPGESVPGRVLDDNAIPEGFEMLLKRFYKIMASKDGEAE